MIFAAYALSPLFEISRYATVLRVEAKSCGQDLQTANHVVSISQTDHA